MFIPPPQFLFKSHLSVAGSNWFGLRSVKSGISTLGKFITQPQELSFPGDVTDPMGLRT